MDLFHARPAENPAAGSMKPGRIIPVAAAHYGVEQMLKAGKFKGKYVKSITDFYQDAPHPRRDPGSYLVALPFSAPPPGHDPRDGGATWRYRRTSRNKKAARVQRLIR